jgi:D-serine deaminase-like pyridoxal phosphate-dependent protein
LAGSKLGREAPKRGIREKKRTLFEDKKGRALILCPFSLIFNEGNGGKPMLENIIGRHKTEVDTPALLLYMDAVERNIATMASFFSDKSCKLRPHIKTHKLPLIAHKQMAAGAIGITCAKLGEAKIFLEAGIENVLIANEIVGDGKIQKLINLSNYGNLIVCVDNFENGRNVSEAARKIGRKINFLVEINVGLNRCGVRPGKPALEFVQKIMGLKNLVFRGLMGYEGGLFINDIEAKKKKCIECNKLLVETKDLIEKNGFPIEIVTAGGSNTFNFTGLYPGITDIQVGSYVTMDSHNRFYGLDFEQAITVLTTVISRPERERAVTDSGMKSLSTDEGLPICKESGIAVFRLNEEHGHLRIENPDHDLSVGDKIELIPSHGCTTIPLHDRYIIIRNDYVESVAEIYARGASQ